MVRRVSYSFAAAADAHPRIGRAIGQEWRLYDVGGTRSSVGFLYPFEPNIPNEHFWLLQRAAWYPYFEDSMSILIHTGGRSSH